MNIYRKYNEIMKNRMKYIKTLALDENETKFEIADDLKFDVRNKENGDRYKIPIFMLRPVFVLSILVNLIQ